MNNKNLIDFYLEMFKIRKFEEKLYNTILDTDLARYTHLSIGRESVSVSIAKTFGENDKIVNTYRTHGIALSLGMNPQKLLTEILMVKDSKSKNGSMYVTSNELGMISTNTIIGAGLPISVGLGMGKKLNKCDGIIWCVIGDGAAVGGNIHEAINIAAKHKLRIIFICENNKLALNTPFKKISVIDDLSNIASLYGIYGKRIDGRNAIELMDEIQNTYDYVTKFKGPAFLHIDVPQLGGHSAYDKHNFDSFSTLGDPIEELKIELLKMYPKIYLVEKEKEIMNQLNEVWIEYENREINKGIPLYHGTGEVSFQNAIMEELDKWMESNPKTLYLGTSIERISFYNKYSEDQMVSLPITENSNLGIAYGLMLDGHNVIVDFMNAAFLYVAMDQLINTIAMSKDITKTEFNANILIKCLVGNGAGMGPQQAHNPTGILMNIPNLNIIYPSSPKEASGLIKFISQNKIGPVILLEHMHLRGLKGDFGDVFPIGKAIVKKEGSFLTIITIGAMVHVSLDVAEKCSKYGIDIEVIDLVSLNPLDLETVINSVMKTKKLLVVDESWPTAGLADHIISKIAQNNEYKFNIEAAAITLENRGAPGNPHELEYFVPNTEKVLKFIIGKWGEQIV